MKTRQLIILLSIALFVGGCFGRSYLANLKEDSVRVAPKPVVRSAASVEVQTGALQGRIPVTGKLVAKDRIEIYAEVSGNLLPSSARFKAGNTFSRGATLVALDNTELALSIISLKSNFLSTLTRILPDLKLDYPEVFPAWKSYTDNFSVEKPLSALPEIRGSEKYYLSTQGVLNQYYSIRSQEARLAKYRIAAPYQGIVSEASIKPGTLVRVGQKLGSFIKTGVFELEVAVGLEHLQHISVGAEAELLSGQVPGRFPAKVARISESLDPATQSALVILEIESEVLKEGMYLNGSIFTQPYENAFLLSTKQVNAQNETFVIDDGKLKKRPLTVLFRGENELLTADLKTGEKVLQNLFDGAKDGMQVAIEGEEAPPANKDKEAQEKKEQPQSEARTREE